MIRMRTEDKIVDFKLEITQEQGGKFKFTATSLTEDFEKELCLQRLARDSVNKHLIWRHRHPINDVNNHAHIFGNVTNSKVVDGKIITEYEPYSHTELHKKFIEEIKEKKVVGDPIGISMRYRKYYDDDGKIIHLDVFEHSTTPFPKCEECLQIDEYIGENKKMSEKPKVDEINSKSGTKTPELDVDIKDHLKKIEELEKALNSKTEALEGYRTKIDSLEKEVIKSKDSIKIETKTLEDHVKSLEEKLENQEKTHKEEIEYLNKKPILDEMFEIKDLDEDEKTFYKTLSLEKLISKRDLWKKETQKPFTKTTEESANEAQEKVNEANNKEKKQKPLTKESINEFVKDERLRSIMYKMIEPNQDKK